MRIGCIIQARTSSTRLPRKVLNYLPFNSNITVLEHVVRRLKRSSKIDEIVIATTLDKPDDAIVEISKKEDVKHFRGSMNNVLERYYLAAKKHHFDLIVRVTSDCPCIDPDIVDLIIERHIDGSADYTSNALKKTYPHGLDAEVFSFDILETAYHNAANDFEKEHVMPYIYKRPGTFRIAQVEAEEALSVPDIRITLDTEQDYALLCILFESLYKDIPAFSAQDIIKLFKEKPWLKFINKSIAKKYKINNLLDKDTKDGTEFLAKNQ